MVYHYTPDVIIWSWGHYKKSNNHRPYSSIIVLTQLTLSHANIYMYIVLGKYLAWERFGKENTIRQCFTCQLLHLYTVVAIRHAAHSSLFYSPIGLDSSIHQYFTPPHFSHLWYVFTTPTNNQLATSYVSSLDEVCAECQLRN